MTAMYASSGVVGETAKGKLPHPPIQALKQGSVGQVMSDLQRMMHDEQRQHMDRYQNGHNDGSAPLGEPSF